MNTQSKDKIQDIIVNDLLSIHNRRLELSKRINENVEESLDYLEALSVQLSQPMSGLIVTKTPKLLRKKVQRIETIPENEVFQQEHTSIYSRTSIDVENQETNETSTKLKRTASIKATDNIKKQSLTLGAKQKKLSNDNSDSISVKKEKRKGQIKRKKSVSSSDEDEDIRSDTKYSKLDVDLLETKSFTRKATKKKSVIQLIEITNIEEKSNTEDTFKSPKLLRSNRSNDKLKSKSQTREGEKEENDTIVASNTDDVEELSMYEDAIGKPTPLMNSTLKYSSVMPEKMLNAVVLLEPLPQERKLNETVVIQKASSARNSRENSRELKKRNKKALQDSTQIPKEIMQNDDCNGLITDDESPIDKKSKVRSENKQNIKKQTKRVKSISSDDEIPNTPVKDRFRDINTIVQESKITHKSNALFSPYAKESVKKRVEAFEQAVMHNPKPVDADAPMRITRTKTRAMTAAETKETANQIETEMKNADKNVTQILARKSLAKAKKISLAKQKKDNGEFKENKEQISERINKLFLNDKSNAVMKQMHTQQKTTPLSKIKIMQPLSVNRFHTPLNSQNPLNKALTASRTNIVTSVDSFIQPLKSISKTNSVEKLEEKKRQEEDARKKREETLRLQTEEKRRKRQEKELKNKLAREAKEKLELEKRQKAEREREEKAKLALLMQEKQREEMEKKRLAQLQRAQEKEERRKLEEQQRLRKLQEQEEAERSLAEQRRREQEAEKRKEAEARAQQQATAEALRQKNQMLAIQAKYKQQNNNKHQGATNYVLDSEPDDDESDDESRPKHEIPYWAQSHVRKMQLALQRHIPQEIVYKFFDSRKCTPDLTEMFHGIDKSRLKRTSSAIWKTPPRISMMEID